MEERILDLEYEIQKLKELLFENNKILENQNKLLEKLIMEITGV